MTDERFNPPQQAPNQPAAPGYGQGSYQQPYDWRYATSQQQYPQGSGGNWDPYRGAGAGPGKPRKRSRGIALATGALAIAVVSAGIGGVVATAMQPNGPATTTITTAAQPGRNVPTANIPVGSVEQVAAKVVPSVVKLETKMGRQSEEGSGIVLSADGLILTNNHVVAAAKAGPDTTPKAPGPLSPLPGAPGAPGAPRRG